MIRRSTDYDIFSNLDLEKIAETVDKKENKKLFDIVDESKVELIKKELKIQGYQVKIEPFNDKWKIFAIIPDKVKYEEAIQSGAFKKLAWGRYCFQRESALGIFNYDFDDGSIWRVMTGENGEEYLIKEIDDENDDEIVRTKLANINEENDFVNNDNVKSIIAILYDNINEHQFINDLLDSNIKPQIYNILNDKIAKAINDCTSKNNFIQSATYLNDVKGIVKTAINTNKLNSRKQLDNLILEYTNQCVLASGKIPKVFN